MLDRELLNQELTKIEKPAGIANPKDFRNEVVKFALRTRAQNGGKNPSWTSYEKLREVIEKRMFSQVEDLLPVISFGSKKDGETEKKHTEFVARMTARGYTERQVRRLVEWYYARETGRLKGNPMQIVDRRLNPGSKKSREPPALSAPRQGRRAAGRARDVAQPRHPRHPRGWRGRDPIDGVGEPRFGARAKRLARLRPARQQGVRRRRHASAPARPAGGGGREGSTRATARTPSASC